MPFESGVRRRVAAATAAEREPVAEPSDPLLRPPIAAEPANRGASSSTRRAARDAGRRPELARRCRPVRRRSRRRRATRVGPARTRRHRAGRPSSPPSAHRRCPPMPPLADARRREPARQADAAAVSQRLRRARRAVGARRLAGRQPGRARSCLRRPRVAVADLRRVRRARARRVGDGHVPGLGALRPEDRQPRAAHRAARLELLPAQGRRRLEDRSARAERSAVAAGEPAEHDGVPPASLARSRSRSAEIASILGSKPA